MTTMTMVALDLEQVLNSQIKDQMVRRRDVNAEIGSWARFRLIPSDQGDYLHISNSLILIQIGDNSILKSFNIAAGP
jgi:hypothetical protein